MLLGLCPSSGILKLITVLKIKCRSQWPRGLRRSSAAARLLRSWVRIPPWAWMSVCCECCVLSGRDLCDELISRPEESYRLWRVVVCEQETSIMRRPWPALGRSATRGGGKLKINIRPKYNTMLSGQDIHLTFDILASESYTCLFLVLFSSFVHSISFKFKDTVKCEYEINWKTRA